MKFGKTSEQAIIESADQTLTAAEDTAALSWERVQGIGLLLQDSRFDDECAELGRELVAIAQTNVTLGKRLRAVFEAKIDDSGEAVEPWTLETELSDEAFEVVSDSFLRGALNRMVAGEGGDSMDTGELQQLVERFSSHGEWSMPGQGTKAAVESEPGMDAAFDATGQIIFDLEFDEPVETAEPESELEAEVEFEPGLELESESESEPESEPEFELESESEPESEAVFAVPCTLSYEFCDGEMRLKQTESEA